MKKAISYSRISTGDQSNWSILGQEAEHREFCSRRGWQLVKSFVDNGQSAKSFDRADWRQLEQFVKANHRNIDYLIVIKFDRFSRNLREALNMIHELETKYKIVIVSSKEDIGLNPETPFFYKWRVDLLTNAEFERLVIVERTKFGIRSGKKNGRFLGKAPYGYKNNRDIANRPIIEVVNDEAEVVKFIYTKFLDGASFAHIRALIFEKFSLKFYKERIPRILSNPTYAGLILIKADGQHPEELIPAIHEAIIHESTWHQVQQLTKRTGVRRPQYNEIAFMKGIITCDICYNTMSCSHSKGKLKYYWYYECPQHRKSYNVDVANRAMIAIWERLSFSEPQLDYLRAQVYKKILDQQSGLAASIKLQEAALTALHKKKEALNKKYIVLESIDTNTYREYKELYAVEDIQIANKLAALLETQQHGLKSFSQEFDRLSNLSVLFQALPAFGKQRMILEVFGRGLSYDGVVYRTPYIHSLFAHKSVILRDLGLMYFVKNAKLERLGTLGDVNTPPTEHPLLSFLNFLKQIS